MCKLLQLETDSVSAQAHKKFYWGKQFQFSWISPLCAVSYKSVLKPKLLDLKFTFMVSFLRIPTYTCCHGLISTGKNTYGHQRALRKLPFGIVTAMEYLMLCSNTSPC